MKVYKCSELFEASLTAADLAKDGIDGLRGDELVRKIKTGEELTLTDGDQITVDSSNGIIQKISYHNKYRPKEASDYFRYNKKAILDTDGEYHPLRDLEKTADFGGGANANSRRGKNTRIVESIQCLVLSYKQHQRRVLNDYDYDDLISLDQRNLDKYLSYVDTGMVTGTEEIIDITSDMLEEYKSNWSDTFIKTANALYMKTRITEGSKSNVILEKKITYRFCHMSSKGGVVEAINKAYTTLSKKIGWGDINMAKWMPADIWAVDISTQGFEYALREEIQECKSISSLNKIIDYYFDTRQLIGISLKKVAKGKKIVMIINKVTDQPVYTLKNFKLTKTSDAASTTCIKIVANRRSSHRWRELVGEETMTIRSFNSGQDINGEVGGSAAAHGKISLNKINEILARNGFNVVPTVEDIKEWWNTKELKQQIKNINDLIISKYGKGEITKSIAREYRETENRLITKYQALFLAWILADIDGAGVDRVIEDMFLYALSIRIDSGKIGRTPKYVRIID